MGVQPARSETDSEALRNFTKSLLNDVRALEIMLREGMFETGVRRIGAEQELALVDRSQHPAPVAMELLGRNSDEHLTTELGRFNVEINLDPLHLRGDCFGSMQQQLEGLLSHARQLAAECDADVVLTGILPTLQKADLGLENMAPRPRYYALNTAMNRLRGDAYHLHLRGTDELIVRHDSVMLEACNTSFQVHVQVSPDEFAHVYNIAQAVTGPVLAAATNSPLLFGRRLWAETRIALFQQALDTRSASHQVQERSPRVSFGRRWVDDSVLDLFREDIARFRVLLGTDLQEDPFAKLSEGIAPHLEALTMHNSTVYRWNRPCYGRSNGLPHLRIENRVLPAGPTTTDEIANAAFWLGLVLGASQEYDDIRKLMDFDVAKANFEAAARMGLGAQFTWLDGETTPAGRLIVDRLLPLAREGLRAYEVDEGQIDHYLGIVESRVSTGRTGSTWILESLQAMRDRGTTGERLSALTAATLRRQREGRPIHEWPLATLEEAGGWRHYFARVEQYMVTDLVTVHEDDVIDLVAFLMDWRRTRHVPVENDSHELVGLVSSWSLLRFMACAPPDQRNRPVPVRDVMAKNLVTISPDTRTLDAIDLMRRERVASLPVVKDRRIVGMVSEHDFMHITRELLEQKLRE